MSHEAPTAGVTDTGPPAADPAPVNRVWSPMCWPETSIFVFGVVFNLPWELLQAPLFLGMADLPYAEGARRCLNAALGDGVLLLLAFWATALALDSRRWIVAFRPRDLALFTGVALGVSVIVERLSIGALDRWSYGVAMVVVPGVGIGLAPFVQWLVLPALVAFFVRGQLTGLALQSRRHLPGKPS